MIIAVLSIARTVSTTMGAKDLIIMIIFTTIIHIIMRMQVDSEGRHKAHGVLTGTTEMEMIMADIEDKHAESRLGPGKVLDSMIRVAEEISKSTKWLGVATVCVDYGWCCTFEVEFFVTATLL